MKENNSAVVNSNSNPAAIENKKNEKSTFSFGMLFFYLILIIVIGFIVMRFKNENDQLKFQNEMKNKVIIGCTEQNHIRIETAKTMEKQIREKGDIIVKRNKEKIKFEKTIYHLKVKIKDQTGELERLSASIREKEATIISLKRINYDIKMRKGLKTEKYQGSDLINYHFMDQISTILNDKSEWKIIYKGTKNGFRAKNFHDKCDNHPNTITIISANNRTFGGFTSAHWHSRDEWSYDPNAFLFSLDTKSGKLTKYNQDGEHHSKKYSIGGSPILGPCFGGGHDVNLFIFFDN
jgi:hypothetical protein